MTSRRRSDLASQWNVKQDRSARGTLHRVEGQLWSACGHIVLSQVGDTLTNVGPATVRFWWHGEEEPLSAGGVVARVGFGTLDLEYGGAVTVSQVSGKVTCTIDKLSFDIPKTVRRAKPGRDPKTPAR